MVDRISIDKEALERKKIFLQQQSLGTLGDVLGINFEIMEPHQLVASMPLERRVMQPFGILHGGASVVLAESIASIGAWLNLINDDDRAVGIEINANHIRSLKSGVVVGTGVPLHIGGSTQVWEIKMTERGTDKLVSVSRCTVAILSTVALLKSV